MKRKLKGVLGVALTLVMVLALSAAFLPIPVAADENEWSTFSYPEAGSAGDWFYDSEIEVVGPIARAINGDLYCAVTTTGTTPYLLMKSTDDGRTWEETDYADDLTGEGAIVDIACSSIDGEIVYVTDGSLVYKTDDGGDTFKTVAKGSLSLTGDEEISSLSVGYLADDSPFVFIGTKYTDGNGGSGQVRYLDEEGFGAAWDSLEIVPKDGKSSVYGLGVSPDFANDTLLVALATPSEAAGELVTRGNAKAEWSTMAEVVDVDPHSGSFSAKLTIPEGATWDDAARVKVPYNGLLSTVTNTNITYQYFYDGVPHNSFVRLDIDANGNGIRDHCLISRKQAATVYNGSWTETLQEDYWHRYTIDETTQAGADVGWDILANQTSAIGSPATAVVLDLLVMLGPTTVPALATESMYIDDITIGNIPTYDLEPGAMVATNYGDKGVWDYLLLLDDAGNPYAIDEGSDPVFPEDFDADDAYEFYVGVCGPAHATVNTGGGVYRVYGTDPDELDLLDDVDQDIISLAGVGDQGAMTLVAGEQDTAVVWYSTDDGESWDECDKNPSGTGITGVVMADTETVWVTASGDEAAVSLSVDGGVLFNQISMIRTSITAIDSTAFSRNFASDETMFMVTSSAVTGGTDSLFRFDGDYWERVFVSTLTEPALDAINLVQLSPDFLSDDTLFVALKSNSDSFIYYSTDGGNDWTKMSRQPKALTSWVVIDEDVVIAGTDDKVVWKTINQGRRTWSDYDVTGAATITSFALSPNFASDDTILLGDSKGQIFISEDIGESWDQVGDEGIDTGTTYVYFDPDYASNNFIYAACDDTVARCEIDTGEDWADQLWYEFTKTKTELDLESAIGLVVSDDGTLYVADSTPASSEAVEEVAEAPGDAFTIFATAAGDTGTIEVTSGSVDVIGSSGMTAPIKKVIVKGDDPVTWTLTDIGDWVTFTAGADGTYGVVTIVGADDKSDIDITYDADNDAFVWAGGNAGSGHFRLPDAEVEASAAAVGGGVWRSLNPTDDMSDVVFELVGYDFELEEDTALASLQLTSGSNVLWARNSATPEELWTYEDLLAAQVVLTSPAAGATIDDPNEVTFKWKELTGADEYTLKYTDDEDWLENITKGTGIEDPVYTADDLDAHTTYYWKVTVSQDEPLLSRYSDVRSFTTELSAVERTTEWMPENGAQDIILNPAFGWTRVSGATAYEFELATSPDFSGATTATPTINSCVSPTTLSYSTTYYWRVRGLKDTTVISDWRSGAFATMAKPVEAVPPVEVTPAPPAPVLPTPTTPAYIWAIIAIGAILGIAVIVLIVRTRRVA